MVLSWGHPVGNYASESRMQTLRKVRVEGFKSIASAEVSLGRLNVIIGANGSGKSNFIGIFRLLERVLSQNL